MNKRIPLISTIKDKCRLCYTCVRDCPAKAIRISEGQAEVLYDRCIGCGNCVKVCSQNAKKFHDSIPEVRRLLDSDRQVAAIFAPSFPADFADVDYRRLIGMVRKLGFDFVCEVAFGADLVARRYKRLLEENPTESYIATSCPALVAYVEKYYPHLLGHLAPVVSPMLAEARVLKHIHGDDLAIVFIGPCLAKKVEAGSDPNREVEAVLTFVELRTMFESLDLVSGETPPSEFDPPHPGLGALFPISGGILQAAGLREDLLTGDIVTANGKRDFVEAVKEFAENALDVRLLEILCCDGCIMGPGSDTKRPLYSRRSAVSEYVRGQYQTANKEEWERTMTELSSVDLSTRFIADDHRIPLPSKEQIDQVMRRMGKRGPEDELDCGACGYNTCREHAAAILKGMAESEMCLPYAIERLKESLRDLNVSNEQLAHTKHNLSESYEQLESTQQALLNAEKLASMGQLSAGIAHEVNNPLGVILIYANLLLEAMDPKSETFEDVKMIVEQAERCKKIVSGLLDFARKNKVVIQETNIDELVKSCLKSIQIPKNIHVKLESELTDPMVEVDPDQIIQVLTNLARNAVEAMPQGGRITINNTDNESDFSIRVSDQGTGISKKNLGRIFEPLFTTKQIGMGTGLGLAVIYGIIKMHHGDVKVESNDDPGQGPTGTTFTVTLPKKASKELEFNINDLELNSDLDDAPFPETSATS